MAMTPRQKWAALESPNTLKDYGVTISEKEMRTFPEGRAFLCAIRKAQRESKWICKRMYEAGKQAGETVDDIAKRIILEANDHNHDSAARR